MAATNQLLAVQPSTGGRPAIQWTQELEEDIANRLVTRSLRQICDQDNDIPSYSSIARRLIESDSFEGMCVRARRLHTLYRLEDVSRQMDECDESNYKSTQAKVQHLQWLAERLLSRDYGNKQQVDLNVTGELTLSARIAEARKRLKPTNE